MKEGNPEEISRVWSLLHILDSLKLWTLHIKKEYIKNDMKRLFYLVFGLILAVGCAGSSDAVLNISVESPVANNVVVVVHR